MMHFVEQSQGSWVPNGGMHAVVKSLISIAQKHGVQFMYNTPIMKIDVAHFPHVNLKSESF